ncbi:MAG: transposase [Patescibacteria group bacterium]
MRGHIFEVGGYYHIYAHVAGSDPIFREPRDYDRGMSIFFCANGSKPIPRFGNDSFDPSLAWEIRDGKIDIGLPLVDVLCFGLMPTHFHLLLREKRAGGISSFMHKVATSYAKYYNIKYDRRGHVFESTFRSKFIGDNRYLLYVSRYIHRNPEKLLGEGRWQDYNWSSYQDFVGQNRWDRLLDRGPILLQFSMEEYREYVELSLDEEYSVIG